MKTVLFGFALCIAGAICIDLEIEATGIAAILLGFVAIMTGPMLESLEDGKNE